MKSYILPASFLLATSLLVAHSSQALPPELDTIYHPLKTPVVSPQLRASLRAQLLAVAASPDLPKYLSSSAGCPAVAMPLARLGYWEDALKIAQNNDTRDQIYQWHAWKLSQANKAPEAWAMAERIIDSENRADILMNMAYAEIDRGQLETARKTLVKATNATKQPSRPLPPEIEDFSYQRISKLGGLWAKANDMEAARRTFARAWPLAQKAQQKREAQWHRKLHGLSAPTGFVLSQMVEAGLGTEALAHISTPQDIPRLMSAFCQTPASRQQLRHWLSQYPDSTFQEWLSLASFEAQKGDKQLAREDYQRGQQLQKQAAASAPDALNTAISEIQLATILKDEEMRKEAETNFDRAFAALPLNQHPSGFELTPAIYRMDAIDSQGKVVLPDGLTDNELGEITTKALAAKPSDSRSILLSELATIYAAKQQWELLTQIAHAMDASRDAQKAQWQKLKPVSLSSGADALAPFIEGAYWLRKAGKNEEALADVRQLARDLAPHVPVETAIALTRFGFPEVAADSVDLRTALKKATTDWRHKRIFGSWQSTLGDWPQLAAIQATYIAPDAPMRWVKDIEWPDMKADVLASWVEALCPDTRI